MLRGRSGHANHLLGKAQSAVPHKLEDWKNAESAVANAKRMVAASEVETDVQRLVRELDRTVQLSMNDGLMVDRLELIPIPEEEDFLGNDVRQLEAKDATGRQNAYAKAFKDYGICMTAEEEAVWGIRSTVIWSELAVALECWAAACRALQSNDSTERIRLLRIANAVDSDPLRQQLHTLLIECSPGPIESAKLLVLAEAATTDAKMHLPMTFLRLGRALERAGLSRQAVDLYRRAWDAYPDDFSLCLRLGVTNEQLQPLDVEEAGRFYTAALAVLATRRSTKGGR